MISKKLQDLHVDCVFYHDVEVDLACEELDEVYDFLYLNYKEEVERMIEGEGEEEALQAQRDLETHLNHHRL